MARNRQRAKQRQAARRERLQQDGAPSAPPQDLGQSGETLEHLPPHGAAEEELEELEAQDEIEDFDPEDEGQPLDPDVEDEKRRARREKGGRGRVLTFLGNVWAELQRVQWPNRQQVTTLTGVVLGFVMIAGGYLGLLDAIFSKLINQII